ncbi:MAG: hypothetical protein QNJ53_28380 [Pleurocapsa sp. MO_192.B19]|nr:hypothetical protein [Pleurocapsa sp. MO_192.B19]
MILTDRHFQQGFELTDILEQINEITIEKKLAIAPFMQRTFGRLLLEKNIANLL